MIVKRQRPRQVFISYSTRDARLLRSLIAVLDRHGISYWLAPSRLIGGDDWEREIGKALRRCDWMLALLTPSFLRALWPRHELKYALRQPRYERRIVPVLGRTCRWEREFWALDAFQRIDLRRRTRAQWAALLAIWGIEYSPAPARAVPRRKPARRAASRRRPSAARKKPARRRVKKDR